MPVAADGPDYLSAQWIPAHPQRYTVKASRHITHIVLHITDGGTPSAVVTAKNMFQDPPPDAAHRTSAHYVVGRDGAVVQCVRNKDMAHHAHDASVYSIGIEHNCRKSDTFLTGIQYLCSARLVLWLGRKLAIDVDDPRYLTGHSDIDTKTSHADCPQRALDWDVYRLAMQDSRTMGDGNSITRIWDFGAPPGH